VLRLPLMLPGRFIITSHASSEPASKYNGQFSFGPCWENWRKHVSDAPRHSIDRNGFAGLLLSALQSVRIDRSARDRKHVNCSIVRSFEMKEFTYAFLSLSSVVLSEIVEVSRMTSRLFKITNRVRWIQRNDLKIHTLSWRYRRRWDLASLCWW
jgi:hypothetical protein